MIAAAFVVTELLINAVLTSPSVAWCFIDVVLELLAAEGFRAQMMACRLIQERLRCKHFRTELRDLREGWKMSKYQVLWADDDWALTDGEESRRALVEVKAGIERELKTLAIEVEWVLKANAAEAAEEARRPERDFALIVVDYDFSEGAYNWKSVPAMAPITAGSPFILLSNFLLRPSSTPSSLKADRSSRACSQRRWMGFRSSSGQYEASSRRRRFACFTSPTCTSALSRHTGKRRAGSPPPCRACPRVETRERRSTH